MEELWSEYGVIAFACLLLLGVLWYFNYSDPSQKAGRLRRKRGKAMEDARRAYLYQLVADKITDGLDDAYLGDQISRKERYELFLWMGQKLGIKDLYPRSFLNGLLKKEIKHRLDSDRYYFDKEGNRKGVIIFPDSPGWALSGQHRHPLV